MIIYPEMILRKSFRSLRLPFHNPLLTESFQHGQKVPVSPSVRYYRYRSLMKEGRRFFRTTSILKQEVPSNNIQVYDSLTEKIQPLPQSKERKAMAWYTFGPTTYAPAHMGHARTYVCLDIMRRVMEANLSQSPLFVMNITDVDDKILDAAAASNEPPLELARRFEKDFWKDLDALNCLRPHVVTHVTEYVESDIVPYIQRLVDKGMAYVAEDGIYFHTKAYNEQLGHITKYGKLAPPAASQDLQMTSNSDDETEHVKKKDPRDFVLWKNRKPDESLSWPSPWGDGRPGWHIECSAMIEAVQEQFRDSHQFLVHAGGVDLKFPHHTNEIAQAEAYRGEEWIPHWVHTGHLHIDGLKMSKSLKNFVSIQDFLKEFDTDDFRLWCLGLSGSYRGPATFSRDRMAEARNIRQKLLRLLVDGEEWIERSQFTVKRWYAEEHELFRASAEARERGLEALQNDLNGTKFVDELVRVAELGNKYLSEKEQGPIEPVRAVIENVRSLLSLVGFSDKTTRAGLSDHETTSIGSHIVGGERAVMDSFCQFRSSVRHAALEDSKQKAASKNMNKILELCDETRDSILPKIGIQLLDGKDEEADGWKICLPKMDGIDTKSSDGKVISSIELESIELEDLFKVGQYDGMFSKFNEDGFPILNADGTEVSKAMARKLMKKQEKHRKRLERVLKKN